MEAAILLWLQSARNPAMTAILGTITYIGELGIGAILACLVLLLIKKYRYAGLTAAFSLAIEFVVTNGIVKNLVQRIRPYVAIEGLVPITKLPHDFSFPSGHAGASFAVAFALLMVAPKKVGVPAVIVAALISFSRLYLGVHYPTDVIGAIAIAFGSALLGMFIGKIIRKKINNH